MHVVVIKGKDLIFERNFTPVNVVGGDAIVSEH